MILISKYKNVRSLESSGFSAIWLECLSFLDVSRGRVRRARRPPGDDVLRRRLGGLLLFTHVLRRRLGGLLLFTHYCYSRPCSGAVLEVYCYSRTIAIHARAPAPSWRSIAPRVPLYREPTLNHPTLWTRRNYPKR